MLSKKSAVINPLTLSPWILIDARQGYDAYTDGAEVTGLVDQSGNSRNLIIGDATDVGATKLAGGSSTGVDLLRFPVSNGLCTANNTIYSRTEDPPSITNGWTIMTWLRMRQPPDSGCLGAHLGIGDATRPFIMPITGNEYAGGAAQRIQIRAVGTTPTTVTFGSARLLCESDGVGQGVHTLSLVYERSPDQWRVFVDGAEVSGSPQAMTALNPGTNDRFQFGNRPTTTLTTGQDAALSADLGAFALWSSVLTQRERRGVENYWKQAFGNPLGQSI